MPLETPLRMRSTFFLIIYLCVYIYIFFFPDYFLSYFEIELLGIFPEMRAGAQGGKCDHRGTFFRSL